jgi:hypothetical protein
MLILTHLNLVTTVITALHAKARIKLKSLTWKAQ